MSYTVKQLAKLAGVSVRTLHYYDDIGLLKPLRTESNGYRQYGEHELLLLQQILFFRELEFPLEDIRRIMASPGFDMRAALRDQRKLIGLKKKRLERLIGTIDKTIKRMTKKTAMQDNELYGSFTKEEMDKYAEEARQRWGDTDAYKQSQERVKKMTKADFAAIAKESEALLTDIVAVMDKGPKDSRVQQLIAKHYNNLRRFYEPNLKLYRGLANMYVQDDRFASYYNKHHPALAQFMHDAMIAFCDNQETK